MHTHTGRFEITIEYWNPQHEDQYLLYVSEYQPDVEFECSLTNQSKDIVSMVTVKDWIIAMPYSSKLISTIQNLLIEYNGTEDGGLSEGSCSFTPISHCIVGSEIDLECGDEVTQVFGYTHQVNNSGIYSSPPELDENWGGLMNITSTGLLPSQIFTAMFMLVTGFILYRIQDRKTK